MARWKVFGDFIEDGHKIEMLPPCKSRDTFYFCCIKTNEGETDDWIEFDLSIEDALEMSDYLRDKAEAQKEAG